jgi:hypothetical protein
MPTLVEFALTKRPTFVLLMNVLIQRQLELFDRSLVVLFLVEFNASVIKAGEALQGTDFRNTEEI